MSPFPPPIDGTVTLADLAAALPCAPTTLHVPDRVALRTVAFRGPDWAWVPFDASLEVGAEGADGVVRAAALVPTVARPAPGGVRCAGDGMAIEGPAVYNL